MLAKDLVRTMIITASEIPCGLTMLEKVDMTKTATWRARTSHPHSVLAWPMFCRGTLFLWKAKHRVRLSKFQKNWTGRAETQNCRDKNCQDYGDQTQECDGRSASLIKGNQKNSKTGKCARALRRSDQQECRSLVWDLWLWYTYHGKRT